MKTVEEREQIIEGLDKRIEEGREHERELKGKLAEAEGRVEELKKRPREAESDVGGGGRAGEEGKGNGKDKGIGEKRGGARAGKTDWEFWRRKGDRLTSFGAMYQIVVKRGTS